MGTASRIHRPTSTHFSPQIGWSIHPPKQLSTDFAPIYQEYCSLLTHRGKYPISRESYPHLWIKLWETTPQYFNCGLKNRQGIREPSKKSERWNGRISVFTSTEQPEGMAGESYGYNRYNILGKGIVSRTCSSPHIHATARSIPIPNPACGTDP